MGDNYVTPWAGYPSEEGQPNAPAALSFVNSSGINIDSTIIAHTSGWGLEFRNDNCSSGADCVAKASADNALTNSALYDIGTSALRLGRMPPSSAQDSGSGGNTDLKATQHTNVSNNLFASTGRLYPGGEAGCIWIGSSLGNTIQYNECSDSYGGGISIGPKSGYQKHFNYDNVVQHNNFHDIGRGVIDDFGCVHFANWGGVQTHDTGNRFESNICHDMTDAVADNKQGGTGIYIDGLSQCDTVKYNLVYRASGALYFNNTKKTAPSTCSNSCPDPYAPDGGCKNIVSNNILAYSYLNTNNWGGAVKRGANDTGVGDTIRTFTFTHNIVYFNSTKGPQWLKNNTGSWSCLFADGSFPAPCTTYFAFYSNAYWSPNLPSPLFATTDVTGSAVFVGLAKWQANSLSSDPGEDGSDPVDGGGKSVYQDPLFKSPGFPADNYRLTGSAPPGFDTVGFANTYTAGRNKPVIFAPFVSPGFPLQLLSPTQY